MGQKGQHRVLVADDDLDEQFLIQRSLKKCLTPGSSVFLVSSGDEAVAYMIGEDKYADRDKYPFPTVVITDLNMAGGDGFDVLEFLQNNQAWSVVPRIVFSSSADADDIRTSYLLGASIFHIKPAEPSGLDLMLRNIVEYWTSGEVPPVDKTGRLMVTESTGRKGARYTQPKGERKMKRPSRRPRAENNPELR